ncbi:MAG TPA: DMT family transporter [Nocardioidaceae bacterium]|nr:DMT family transporter [Nocardioidaceae bacterium]
MTTPTRPASATSSDHVALGIWLPGLVGLAAIWGCSFVFIEVGIRELHPTYVTLGRVLTGAITLLIILGITRQSLPRSPRLWAHLFLLGGIGVALPFTLFGYGEQRVPSLLAGIWNGTTPLVVLPLAVLVFRTERLTIYRLAGLVLGFVGGLTVLGVWRGVGGGELTGQMLCLAAAACYGVAIPYQKRFIADAKESGPALSAGMLIAAVVQLLVVAPLIAGAPPNPTDLSFKVVASVVALGALGTGVAFVIHMHNIRLIGASRASMVTYLVPVFAVTVGILVLGESVTWYQPLGALIVLAGVAVSHGPRTPAPHVEPEPEPVVAPDCSSPYDGQVDEAEGEPQPAG